MIAVEPCLHSFCSQCIYRYTRVNETCPVCSQDRALFDSHIETVQTREALMVQLTQLLRKVLDDKNNRLQAVLRIRHEQLVA